MRRQRAILVVLGAFALSCGESGTTDSPGLEVGVRASAVSSGTVPKSLFVQVSTLASYSDATLREWFQHVCDYHKDAGKADYIYNLVIQDVADSQGRLYKKFVSGTSPGDSSWYHPTNWKLDVVDDYLSCFDNVFAGTADIPWGGAGSKYKEGILDSSFRWQNINVSTTVMDRFISNYPSLTFHWYITYEANLNYFTDNAVKEAYLAYNLEMVNRMRDRRGGTAVLWSPGWWSRYGSLSTSTRDLLRNNLDNHFARIASESRHQQGITWLHFQDMIGATWCWGSGKFTTTDVQQYHGLLNAMAYDFASLRVNMEQYEKDCSTGALLTGSLSEHQARENDYQAKGLPVGASWEIRFWRNSHTEL